MVSLCSDDGGVIFIFVRLELFILVFLMYYLYSKPGVTSPFESTQ